MTAVLSIWTIYWSPKNYPDQYVARRWEVGGDPSPRPTEETLISDSLPDLRALLPPGLVMLDRFGEDDPCIVETWL